VALRIGGSPPPTPEAVAEQWRSQLLDEATGRPPAAVTEQITLGDRTATIVRMVGRQTDAATGQFRRDQRLIGVVLEDGDRLLAIRLLGPRGTVDAAEEDFLRMVGSLHRRSAENDSPAD